MGVIEMVKNWSTYGECQQTSIEVQIDTVATTVLSRLDEIKDITCICVVTILRNKSSQNQL